VLNVQWAILTISSDTFDTKGLFEPGDLSLSLSLFLSLSLSH
jgi:hypothetical protein